MKDEEILEEAMRVGEVTSARIFYFSMHELRSFARRIAEIEREECAKVCEKEWATYTEGQYIFDATFPNDGKACAAAIRARSEK